jgi:hypothetical protein
MADVIVALRFERETKNTYRYAEIVGPDEQPVIGTLYVQKSAIPATAPQELTVTISAVAS